MVPPVQEGAIVATNSDMLAQPAYWIRNGLDDRPRLCLVLWLKCLTMGYESKSNPSRRSLQYFIYVCPVAPKFHRRKIGILYEFRNILMPWANVSHICSQWRCSIRAAPTGRPQVALFIV